MKVKSKNYHLYLLTFSGGPKDDLTQELIVINAHISSTAAIVVMQYPQFI